MPVVTLEEWKTQTSAILPWKKSRELQEITRCFEIHLQRKTQASLTNLASSLEIWWSKGLLSERDLLVGLRNDLADTIANDKVANLVLVTQASNVGLSRLIQLTPFDPSDAWILPILDHLHPLYKPALKPSQIYRLNEAFERTAKAATLARDELIKIATKSALGAATPDRDYIEIFGVFDQARARRVRDNFKAIKDALDRAVILYDIRNSIAHGEHFAMCMPGRVVRSATGIVTSQIKMYLANGFFTTYDVGTLGKYGGTTAATVWTLIHELAHGAFYAVDAPPVRPDNSWVLEPKTDVAVDADRYGESPNNLVQSSGEEYDLRLAVKDPVIAICNADSYGLFAFRCLRRSEIV